MHPHIGFVLPVETVAGDAFAIFFSFGMWDLSSLARDQTCIGNTES